MKILITGSSGMVGTNLALAALDAGHEVLGIDRRPNAWSVCIPTRLIDLVTEHDAAVTLARDLGPDVIVHLAAHPKVHASVQDPWCAFQNFAAAQAALEMARLSNAALVFASSREVYGNTDLQLHRESDVQLASASPYAASKLAAESMAHAYHRCYGMNTMILRLSNVYGRYDHDLQRVERVIPLFIRRASLGLPLTLFHADKVLDPTYVDDVVSAILTACARLMEGDCTFETVHLSGGDPCSLRQLAMQILELVGTNPGVIEAPMQTGEIQRFVADLEHARRVLEYRPSISLAEGLQRTVAQMRGKVVDLPC